jgi:CheY-like chemotaxis protein
VNTDKMIRPPRVVSAGAVLAAGKPPRHRALLVEDHPAIAEATAELMRLHGLEVRVARTGRDALEMAEAFDPVLILCDMRLPDMAGLEVAEALRARCRGSDLLIAIITATSADCLREFEGQATTRAVNLFLSKPLTNETLIGLLSELETLQPR